MKAPLVGRIVVAGLCLTSAAVAAAASPASPGLDNLCVMDGSVLPTALGVNPMISIVGAVSRAAAALARSG